MGAFGGLGCAVLLISLGSPAAAMAHWLYAAGVSLYSTALVFAPTAERRIEASRAAIRAGILYAVAGWAGSAFGIGMAQDLHRIPYWFLGLAGAIVLCGAGRAAVARRVATIAGIGLLVLLVTKTSGNAGVGQGVAAGREVYISEGCINCHTQFVRPGTREELWWGPAANAGSVLKQAPPLIGNRRQGPDLLDVGNRRSLAWNRIHLVDPRALSPESRMPSYAYLFAPGDRRGDALVAYLASLGEETFDWRAAACLKWQPAAEPISRSAQAALFQSSCAQCHGTLGRGGGPLAASVGPVPPRDLTLGEWRFFARGSREPAMDIARTIKFGVAGTSMPGHESFSDSEVIGLAQYVLSLSTNRREVTP